MEQDLEQLVVKGAVLGLEAFTRCPPLLSPNVILNEMSDDERAAFAADYVRQGPGGRPAPAQA